MKLPVRDFLGEKIWLLDALELSALCSDSNAQTDDASMRLRALLKQFSGKSTFFSNYQLKQLGQVGCCVYFAFYALETESTGEYCCQPVSWAGSFGVGVRGCRQQPFGRCWRRQRPGW